ncbi:hypothetical protein LTR23_011198, partial [Exophiala sp. CCFEE 6169]
ILKAHRIAWVQAENGPRALRPSTTAKPLDFVGGSFGSVVPAKRPAKDEDAPIPIDPVLLEGDTLVDDDEDVLDFDQLAATEAENFDVPVDTDVVNEDDGKEGGTLLSRVSEYIFDHAIEDDSKETGEDVLNVFELAFQRLHVTPTMQITKPITEFLPDEWCAKLFTINIVMDSDLSRGSGKNPPPEQFQGRIPFAGTRDQPSCHLAIYPPKAINIQHTISKTSISIFDSYKYKDKDCDLTTSSSSKIDSHWLEKHVFGEYGDCNFPGCDILDLFDSLAAFKQHIKDTHPADEIEPRPYPPCDTRQASPSQVVSTSNTATYYEEHPNCEGSMLASKQYSEVSVGSTAMKRNRFINLKLHKDFLS